MGNVLIIKNADFSLNKVETINMSDYSIVELTQMATSVYNYYVKEDTGAYTANSSQRAYYVQVRAGEKYKVALSSDENGLIFRWGFYSQLPEAGAISPLHGIIGKGFQTIPEFEEVTIPTDGYLIASGSQDDPSYPIKMPSVYKFIK